MKIDNLKINGFGKIAGKEIKLNKNINILYGKNETGKSTILNFIYSMFYGASKTKNGKNISVFDKYKPWKTEEFSGKIKYTLDNGKTYEVYREFKKKSPTIYNDKLEDISNTFKIDKSKGIDFLYDQIGISEETFANTVITPQDEIAIDKSGQNFIIQKISNIVSSGDENVSFKKTLDRINKLQNEQVGTDRTSGRPINIVSNKIESLEKEKIELEELKSLLENSSDNYEDIYNNIDLEEKRLKLLKKVKDNLEKNKFSDTELDVNQKIKEEFDRKIEVLENKVDIRAKQNIRAEKKNFTLYWVSIIAILIITIITFFIGIPKVFPAILFILLIVLSTITLEKINKFNKEKENKIKEIDELQNKIRQEIEILKNNKKEREEEINFKEEKVKKEKEEANNIIIQEFENELDINFIKMILEMNIDEVLVAISNKEERINKLKLDIQTKKIERNQMTEKTDRLSTVQEELENGIQEREELISLNNSFNIAKECMEEAYEEIRNSLNPIFIQELNSLIDTISNSKYKNVKFNDEEGLTVEVEDGRYLQIGRLSTGTIDQMYLALRLSSINSISDENMPIILDESFVYFDDDRLKNIFKFINDNYPNKQVIIFTCSKREEEALKNLQINYTVCEL